MRRRIALIGLLSLVPAPVWAQPAKPWLLVTPDEVRKDRAHGQSRGGVLAVPNASGPEIRVQQPDANHPLHAPLSFRVLFVPKPGAAIDVSSFHATYGFFGIDITSRLLQHAHLGPDGLSAENVDIPSGDHRVTLAIADTAGRQTSETFHFTVQ
jgi:hypothetical protein